jgi:hypothetical protein
MHEKGENARMQAQGDASLYSAGRAIYSMMDLFVGFDHRALAEESRDITTFQTPLGTYRLTVLPQGWTDSPAVFQNDVAFILQAELDVAPNFQDDVNVLGPHTRYETPDGSFELISENAGIRRFVWEHCKDVNRVLHRLKHAGALQLRRSHPGQDEGLKNPKLASLLN